LACMTVFDTVRVAEASSSLAPPTEVVP
jgi:hypothetical protein